MMFNGHNLLKEGTLRNDCLGYVPQTDPLIPELSVFDNLLLWYKGRRTDFGGAILTPSIAMLGIEGFLKKPVKALSGGMRKRVSIATALINEPEILILDEPASALDLCYKADIRGYLKEYQSAGHTVIMSTHDAEDLDICDRLYLLKDGEINETDKAIRGAELLALLR
jgi:ABC-type multidrug transport system ATPase subunit